MKRTNQSGFTIVEMSVVLVIIGLMTSIVFIYVPDAQIRARDKERQSDIDTLHARLEEYYQDKGAYPATVEATLFPRIDPAVLVSPNNEMIQVNPPVATQMDARDTTNPDITGPQYTYTAYPSGCSTNCVGYILKTYTESPSAGFPNPYIQGGLHNN